MLSVKLGLNVCEYWMFATLTWETRELHPRTEVTGLCLRSPKPS